MLQNVEPGKEFVAHNGERYHSLYELAIALKNMDQDTFNNHVNNEKNDFAAWVAGVFKNEKFAEKLKTAKNKDQLELALLKEAVVELVDTTELLANVKQTVKALL